VNFLGEVYAAVSSAPWRAWLRSPEAGIAINVMDLTPCNWLARPKPYM